MEAFPRQEKRQSKGGRVTWVNRTGWIEIKWQTSLELPPGKRYPEIFNEFHLRCKPMSSRRQGARRTAGRALLPERYVPVSGMYSGYRWNNLIPEWNDQCIWASGIWTY